MWGYGIFLSAGALFFMAVLSIVRLFRSLAMEIFSLLAIPAWTCVDIYELVCTHMLITIYIT